ncbi:hypothetical protein C672_1609 [[Clostridium] bifermentans ATCC 638]|uniref:Uncharacterized protein n=1 Tax=Paraclostridium bifermentans ATCC 638 = DSM 14991 TaxID=1233171 RepID=T4VNG8_PARBF|nr:hypothetical protein C672_1609 [[Clostridium] bifermentans ATCC 638] [Paraclostridium bifermentans ATCC 638 = DSM 14991]
MFIKLDNINNRYWGRALLQGSLFMNLSKCMEINLFIKNKFISIQ